MARSSKSRGLGRGLSALMSDVAQDAAAVAAPKAADMMVPIEYISPNPDQPRRSFAQDAMDDLANSIAEKGVIQPIIVRKIDGKPQAYEIVAGERRWRAAQIAKRHEIPVILRDYDDVEVLEIAIIENIQRADLNPIDEGAGYRQLMDKFGHTQDQLAKALGKSRSHIANLMRLLTLPDAVQSSLISGELSAGHARALIGHENASALAREVIQRKLSVRQTEQLVKQGLTPKKPSQKQTGTVKDADTIQIENELTVTLGMKVSIDHKQGEEGGKLAINYKSLDQLDDLLRALSNR